MSTNQATCKVTIAVGRDANGRPVNYLALSDAELKTMFKDIGANWKKPQPEPVSAPVKPFQFAAKLFGFRA